MIFFWISTVVPPFHNSNTKLSMLQHHIADVFNLSNGLNTLHDLEDEHEKVMIYDIIVSYSISDIARIRVQ